jgi:hypothetical protein
MPFSVERMFAMYYCTYYYCINSKCMDCDHLATLGASGQEASYPWSMLWCMLFNDYTSVL